MIFFKKHILMCNYERKLCTNFFSFSILLVTIDDGGGMSPEAMRRCMSFGFTDKKAKSAIGRCKDCSFVYIL